LNRLSLLQQQEQLHQIYRDMRRSLLINSGLAVFLGLVIAVFIIRYAGRLEARIRRQRQEALENQQSLQRLSARLVHAQEEERRIIARELHDEVGQALTAMKMELGAAQRAAAGAAQPIAEARAIADRLLQGVRDLSQFLHPAMLDDLGLPDTLNWHLRGFAKRTGIQAELVHHRMDVRLAPQVELCAYRIVQEALTNVARHAQAASCRVFLHRLAHTLLITVEDDGVGFDPAATRTGDRGLGLIGIQERVAAIGGTFRLESSPGRGTRLSVELPALPAEQRPAEEWAASLAEGAVASASGDGAVAAEPAAVPAGGAGETTPAAVAQTAVQDASATRRPA
jgi:signal transduction histidine kinase